MPRSICAVFWMSLLTISLSAADTWPQYGGPNRDFIVTSGPLAESWPAAGPTVLWKKEIGKGYSGIVSDGQRLFTMFRDGDDDVVVALNPADGAEIWRYRYTAKEYEQNVTQFGTGPNATPLIAGDLLITAAYNGKIHALSTKDGSVKWSHDLVADFGSPVLQFGYSNCPIRYKENVLIPVGGEHGMIAFKLTDGSIAWKGEASSISYAPPELIEVEGVPHLVYFGADAVFGLNPDSGRIDWRLTVKNQYDNHASAAILTPDNLLWVASQMESGTRGLRLAAKDGKVQMTEQAWFNERIKIHYWNAVPDGDMMLAVSGGSVGFLSGIDIKSGEILWRERGFAPGNLLRTDGKVLLLDENGELHLLKANRDGLTRLASHALLTRVARTAPSLIGTTLYARDQKTIIAVDLAR